MNQETLQKGNSIQKEIKDLKDHLISVFKETNKYGEYKGSPVSRDGRIAKFGFSPWFSDEVREIDNKFVPFPIDKFMKIYKANVEEEIARLEKEFENL